MKNFIQISKIFLACFVLIVFCASYTFADYTDSNLEFSDNFDCPNGSITDNEDYSGRQGGDWAVCQWTIDDGSAPIAGNRVALTRGTGCHPDHTLNSIDNNFNMSIESIVFNFDSTYALFGTELHGTDHNYEWWIQNIDNGGNRPVFQIDGSDYQTRSYYRNYEWDEHCDDQWNHFNVLYSARDTSHFWTACFCEGEPITAGQSNYGTILRIANAFPTSANMKLICWAGSTSVDVGANNYIIKSVNPTYNISDWTDDTSSMISSSRTYTHKINFGGSSVSINGVSFTGHSSGTTSNTTWRLINNVNEATMTSGSASTTISGDGATLANSVNALADYYIIICFSLL